jgi:HK97 family phage major capsid protein
MRVKELRELRAKHVFDAQEILKKADQMTAEDEQRFDTLMAEADKLKVKIDREERAEAAAAEMDRPIESRAGRSDPSLPSDPKEQKALERRAFLDWAANGPAGMSPENRAMWQRRQTEIPKEFRAQTITTTGGGYTIQTDLLPQLEVNMLAFSNMRQACRVLRTNGGNPINIPTVNDTTNKATLTGINTQTADTNLVFGQVVLDAYAFRSLILVPFELMQDTEVGLEAYISEALAERIARGTEEYFTTGTGSSQPQGIVGASSAGATAEASAAISYNDLVELEHSIDPAYRYRPGVRWMFHDTILKTIKKLKDADNRPLWAAGVAVREPDTILGYPYTINQNMATINASVGKVVLFGNMQKFMIRDVSSMIMLRLTERYADYAQVGFFVFSRHDSEMLDAGTDPVKHLVLPSP